MLKTILQWRNNCFAIFYHFFNIVSLIRIPQNTRFPRFQGERRRTEICLHWRIMDVESGEGEVSVNILPATADNTFNPPPFISPLCQDIDSTSQKTIQVIIVVPFISRYYKIKQEPFTPPFPKILTPLPRKPSKQILYIPRKVSQNCFSVQCFDSKSVIRKWS